MKRIVLSIVAVLIFALPAMAEMQEGEAATTKKRKPIPVTTELGLLGGVSYPWMRAMRPEGMTASFSPTVVVGGTLQFRVDIGKVFAVQPEVIYNYSVIRITDESHGVSAKVKCNTVQMPLLLSVNIAMVRINVGPVFTLMDSPYYMLQSEKIEFGRLFPTVTYTAGVAVRIVKHLVIDLRYYGQFGERKSHNAYVYNPEITATEFKTRHSSLQLRVGYAF